MIPRMLLGPVHQCGFDISDIMITAFRIDSNFGTYHRP